MGQQHRGGAEAVAVHVPHVAAEAVQEPVHLALRVVEPARAGPAVRAAVHRFRPVIAVDPAQLPGQQVQRHVPGHRHERPVAAPRSTRAVVQPALAHVRHGDAGPVVLSGGDVADQRHRLRVTTPRPHLTARQLPGRQALRSGRRRGPRTRGAPAAALRGPAARPAIARP